VAELVGLVHRRFPNVTVNTYRDHPWPGWDGQSFDVWGPGGRGDAIDLATGQQVKRFLREMPGLPNIRHHIYLHELWTSFGGYTRWISADHAMKLRHFHVTYW
jgi:hypothetical protein